METNRYADSASDVPHDSVQNRQALPFSKDELSFHTACNGALSWRWRSEISLYRVASGRVLCRAAGLQALFDAGHYFLVNADALHMFAMEPDCGPARLELLSFSPAFIAEPDTPVYARYVAPPAASPALPMLRLNGPFPWQDEVCRLFDEVYAMDAARFGYELLARSRLTELWLLIAAQTRAQCRVQVPESQLINDQRAKKMLAFIRERYHENLTIDAIASSASISRSECFRCFKRAINKKPIEYLTEFRVERAIDLLLSSSLSISDICYRCGFSSPSYFGKVFRSLTGLPPRNFRHAMENRAFSQK